VQVPSCSPAWRRRHGRVARAPLAHAHTSTRTAVWLCGGVLLYIIYHLSYYYHFCAALDLAPRAAARPDAARPRRPRALAPPQACPRRGGAPRLLMRPPVIESGLLAELCLVARRRWLCIRTIYLDLDLDLDLDLYLSIYIYIYTYIIVSAGCS
jgi:hypothetical protein